MNVTNVLSEWYDAEVFTPEQKQKIAAAFVAKNLNPCPSCGKLGTWTVGDGLVIFPFVTSVGQRFVQGGQSYPCVPLLCSYCGNTMFHNAFTLGVGVLLGLIPTPATMPPIPEPEPQTHG